MMRWLLSLALLVWAITAQAHVGSPDLFYNGEVGPYPARVTIRMPRVIPGRAEISVRLDASHPVDVSFLPLYAKTDIKNAPPPDLGKPVPGEANLYSGELWLMSFGAYSVEVRVKGHHGEGTVQIPLTSVATGQLPMPSLLGNILAILGCILVIGAVGIAAAAAREAGLGRGQLSGKRERRNGLFAAAATLVIMAGALYGGREWWKSEENAFRRHLREGAWPDLAADVDVTGKERVVRLEIGKEAFKSYQPPLIPDHGKLMHLFLIQEGSRDAFAHVHPVRKSGRIFEVSIPEQLPEGRYTIFCDLTFEGGTSSTATTSVELPAISLTEGTAASADRKIDPDDSWASYTAEMVPNADNPAPVFRLPDGTTVTWKAQKPIRVQQDASLHFEIRDATGKPIPFEPYMGMLSHAAVLRSDGSVFAHLHPTGNYSMAAQSFFTEKLAKEGDSDSQRKRATRAGGMGHEMHHGHGGHSMGTTSTVYLPYEFPESGDYRIWVQFKTGGRIITAAFDARVEP